MSDTEERWEPVNIIGYSDDYLVSTFGNVWSVKSNRMMKPFLLNGYYSVPFSINGKKKNNYVHRLVALTFITNDSNCEIVNHKDGNKSNNHVSNLEWTTQSGNRLHAMRTLGILPYTRSNISTNELIEIPDGKQLDGYPNYIITQNGRVYSYNIRRYLSFGNNSSGYVTVQLLNNGLGKTFYVHILVATLFCENPEGKPLVNHKDRNRSNNNADNLEWVTYSENMLHAYSTGVKRHFKPVVQYNPDGTVIQTFNSVKEASLLTGIEAKKISRDACSGRYSTGYFWRYK